MTALFYLLSFLSGFAAAFTLALIIRARRRAVKAQDELSQAYTSILNY